MDLAREELEEMAIRPAKRRLEGQMQPIKAQRERHGKPPHHFRFHVLKSYLDPDRSRVEAHATSLGSCACIV